MFFKPEVTYSSEQIYVYLTAFNSPDDFYIQIDEYSYKNEYEALFKQIQKFYSSHTEDIVDWKIYFPMIGEIY